MDHKLVVTQEMLDDAARKHVSSNGMRGEALSLIADYTNASAKNLRWRCGIGHEWLASWSVIKKGHWCYDCGVESRVAKRRRVA